MTAIFEIIGGFTRYLIYNGFQKVTGKNKTRNLGYFMEDKKGQIFSNTNKDYFNGFVGFVVFALTLWSLYIFIG